MSTSVKPHEFTISTITLQVALAIGEVEIFNQIERFSREATDNEYTFFTHYSYYYSYPEWGKEWPCGNYCMYHKVRTKCHLCDYMPERNFAGVGTLFLLNNGICNKDILVSSGTRLQRGRVVQQQKYIPNTPRLSRMILLCPDHVGSYFFWNKSTAKTKELVKQLELF